MCYGFNYGHIQKNNESAVQKEWTSHQQEVKARGNVTFSDCLEHLLLLPAESWESLVQRLVR